MDGWADGKIASGDPGYEEVRAEAGRSARQSDFEQQLTPGKKTPRRPNGY